MKLKLVLLFLIIHNFSFCQNIFYVDSINNSLNELPKKQQLQFILNIPYDKFISNITSSEIQVQKAIVIATELNDLKSLAEAYQLMSQVYAFQDKRKNKIKYRLKAISIFEEIGEIERAGYSYGELGFSIKYENMEKALFYMRKGLHLLIQTNKEYKTDATYDNYGVLQGLIKNYDSALYYHNKSLNIKKKNNDSIGIPYGYVHLATINIQLKNYKKAKSYIDSAHVIRLKRNDNYGIIDDYVYYGDLYFAEKKYPVAIKNFKKGYDLSLENNFQSLQKYCASYLTKSYESIQDFKNAHAFNKTFNELKDSTLNIKTNNMVAELQIEFETKKKEREIIQQKEQLLKNELQLKNKNLFNLLLSSGILILAIITFGLFKRQQHKKREFQNKLKLKESQTFNKLQDQRLRISRDLHDNIGSQLTFIISSIDNLKFLTKKSNENLRNKLTEINAFATNTIFQLRDTIWAMNKNKISFENLQTRILSFIEKAKSATKNIKFDINTCNISTYRFSSIQGINIFRVIQEAINNSIKYSSATIISIDIEETKKEIKIKVTDNGKGFDLKTIERGNGLDNMHSRIQEINGHFSINSNLNEGTTIKIICSKNSTNAV